MPAGQMSTPRPGAQHMLNADYFKRIDALNYTMLHDDGQGMEGMEGMHGGDSARGADATASSIRAVAWATKEADALAQGVRQAAGELASSAQALRESTSDFLRTLRAA